jgi:hypothetical protein
MNVHEELMAKEAEIKQAQADLDSANAEILVFWDAGIHSGAKIDIARSRARHAVDALAERRGEWRTIWTLAGKPLAPAGCAR